MVECGNCHNQVVPVRNISWFFFGVLFLVFFPAALVYFSLSKLNLCPICRLTLNIPPPARAPARDPSVVSKPNPLIPTQWSRNTWIMVTGSLLVIVVIAIVVPTMGQSDEEKAASAVQEAEDKRQGFHCLNKNTGRHWDMESLIKQSLKDPDSFEEVDTLVGDVENGEHLIWVDYRARNSFGGMVSGSASAYVDTETCLAKADTLVFQ